MKGILIEPGKEPVVTTLPDTLQGIEALLRCPVSRKSCHAPRSAGVRHHGQRPEPYLSRPAYLRPYPLLWLEGNDIQPMSKDVQAEMLDRLKDTEVRV